METTTPKGPILDIKVNPPKDVQEGKDPDWVFSGETTFFYKQSDLKMLGNGNPSDGASLVVTYHKNHLSEMIGGAGLAPIEKIKSYFTEGKNKTP